MLDFRKRPALVQFHAARRFHLNSFITVFGFADFQKQFRLWADSGIRDFTRLVLPLARENVGGFRSFAVLAEDVLLDLPIDALYQFLLAIPRFLRFHHGDKLRLALLLREVPLRRIRIPLLRL